MGKRHYSFHVNRIPKRKKLKAYYVRDIGAGLVFLALLLVGGLLQLHNNWNLVILLPGTLLVVGMMIFPFYSDALIQVSEEGITLKTTKTRFVKWSDIESISFELRPGRSDYDSHIETIIQIQGEELRFAIYRYLAKSKRKITQEFISAILSFPGTSSKLPQELVDRYSES